jgi:tetratricopeptide (TPR) repeat protein
MLAASRGTFSLSIAVCNSPALRDHLIERLREAVPGIVRVSMAQGVADPFGHIAAGVEGQHSDAVFVTDLERLIPSGAGGNAAVRSLNASRELWPRRFNCPVVLWLPEYASRIVSMEARDLWRYRSHRFEFVAEEIGAAAPKADPYWDGISDAVKLSEDEKRFRIAELEERVAAAGTSHGPALVHHQYGWLNELGVLYEELGRNGEAEGCWRRMADLAIANDSPGNLAVAYGNLGIVMQTRGDLDGAEAMHRKALAINEKLGRLEGMASDYGNLGVVMRTRGDLDGAEAMHRKSLAIHEKLGRLEGMASDYSNFGIVMKTRGDLDGAEAMYRKALEIDEELGRLEGMANSYANLGNVMRIRGDREGARGMWIRSRDLFARIGAQHMVDTLQGWIDGLSD